MLSRKELLSNWNHNKTESLFCALAGDKQIIAQDKVPSNGSGVFADGRIETWDTTNNIDGAIT